MTSLVNQEEVTATIKTKLEDVSFTKIAGQPDIHSFNQLVKEAVKAAAMIKTSQANRGANAGMSYLVLSDEQLQNKLNDVNITTTRLQRPPNINPLINEDTTAVETLQLQTAQKERNYEFCKQEGLDSILVLKVADAVEEEWIDSMKDDDFEWNNVTCKALLEHIKDSWCKISTVHRTNVKKHFAEHWDPSIPLLAYKRQQTQAQKMCVEVGASATDADKLQTFVESMYASERFTEDDLSKWENKPDDQKTYALAYKYFQDLDNEHKNFQKNMEASRNGYESTSLMLSMSGRSVTSGGGGATAIQGSTTSVRGSEGATINGRYSNNFTVKGDKPFHPDDASIPTQLMDDYTVALEENLNEAKEHIAALKDNHEAQLRELKEAGTSFQAQQMKMMEMLTQQLAALSGGVCGPVTAGGGTGGKPRKQKRKCGVCGMEGYHEDDECFKLEKNKAKRPAWAKKKYGE